MNDITPTRMLLTTAVFAAIAVLFAGPANAVWLDVEGGGSSSKAEAAAAAAPAFEPGTIPYLSHGIGVDESLFSGERSLGLTGDSALTRVERQAVAPASELDPAIRTAIAARSDNSTASFEPGTIPYMSHGIGVDESQFSGLPSLGLTGDSPLGRVAAPEPEGLTGDSALTRVDRSVTASTQSGSGDERDWTWIGFGAGSVALLAAAMAGLYISARHRGGVALP